MPTFEGLTVEIQPRGGSSNVFSFEEYESSECVNKSSGRSVHRLLQVPPDIPFQLFVSANETFGWHNKANALKIQIDFDNGEEVKDVEVFVARPDMAVAVSTQLLSRTSAGEECIHLGQIIRPLESHKITVDRQTNERLDHEAVSFRTVRAQDQGGSRARLRNEGSIKIAVYPCQLQPSNLLRASSGGSPAVQSLRASASSTTLVNAGIRSKVELFDRVHQTGIPRNFRSYESALAGLFIFHYRIPEEYRKLKTSDQAKYSIVDAGPGKRRVTSVTPDPEESEPTSEDTSSSITPMPPPPPSFQCQNGAVLEDEDTIEVLTDDAPTDSMDIDEPASPASTEDSLFDEPNTEDYDMNIHDDEKGMKNRHVTGTDLEYMLDREEEIEADLAAKQDRMQDEYWDALQRIHAQNDKHVAALKELEQTKERDERSLRLKEEEIERLKRNATRMDAEYEDREKELGKVRKEVADMEANVKEHKKILADYQGTADKLRLEFNNLSKQVEEAQEERGKQERLLKRAAERKQQR